MDLGGSSVLAIQKARNWVALGLMSAIALAVMPAWSVEPGQLAPEFQLASRSGTLRLSDLRGSTVYLDFWASWCGPCKQSFPWMNEMQARYGAQGLKVVAVDVDQKSPEGRAFLERVRADFEVVFDPQGGTPKAYSVKAMPSSLLIGPDGRVIFTHSGFRMDERQDLERRIRQALQIKD